MTVELFWDIASKVGLPFALVVLALWTGKSGVWVWGREVEYERRQVLAQALERAQQSDAEKAELRRDRDYYRDIAFEALNRAEGAATTAEQAVSLAEQRTPRRLQR